MASAINWVRLASFFIFGAKNGGKIGGVEKGPAVKQQAIYRGIKIREFGQNICRKWLKLKSRDM